MERPNNDDLKRWDREVVWHSFSQMAEYDGLIIDEAKGSWMRTIDGTWLLDGVSSLWCNIHGHRHPVIDQAIRDQLDRVAHVTSLGLSNPTTIALAKRLVDLAPKGLQHVFFSSDGSSAVEVGMKLVFQYWRQRENPQLQRTTFLAVGNAYHGDTIGSVSVGGIARFHAMFDPLLFPVLRGPCPDTYRLPRDVPPSQACEYYLSQYEAILNSHSERIAAVVIEPLVQGAAGMVMHPPGFLRGLRELTKAHDVLLIADEIAVGMGRTGTMFACEQESVSPDVLCLGKGLTGGYLPMAATLATHEIWQAFLGEYAESKSFFHGHTYSGNPLSAAAALATLDVFDQEETLTRLSDKAQLLRDLLEPLRSHPKVGDIRQSGLIAAVELVEDRASKTPYPWSERRGVLACQRALEDGVWLRPLGNVLILMPPLNIDESDLELLVKSVRNGIQSAVID
jgi:adenosylmethionine---8-amino-7-oxononanoate aminotransferase